MPYPDIIKESIAKYGFNDQAELIIPFLKMLEDDHMLHSGKPQTLAQILQKHVQVQAALHRLTAQETLEQGIQKDAELEKYHGLRLQAWSDILEYFIGVWNANETMQWESLIDHLRKTKDQPPGWA